VNADHKYRTGTIYGKLHILTLVYHRDSHDDILITSIIRRFYHGLFNFHPIYFPRSSQNVTTKKDVIPYIYPKYVRCTVFHGDMFHVLINRFPKHLHSHFHKNDSDIVHIIPIQYLQYPMYVPRSFQISPWKISINYSKMFRPSTAPPMLQPVQVPGRRHPCYPRVGFQSWDLVQQWRSITGILWSFYGDFVGFMVILRDSMGFYGDS